MTLATRALISLLAGLGSGLLGFWVVWELIQMVAGAHPSVGHDDCLLAGMFLPFFAGTLLVFQTLSRLKPAAVTPAAGGE